MYQFSASARRMPACRTALPACLVAVTAFGCSFQPTVPVPNRSLRLISNANPEAEPFVRALHRSLPDIHLELEAGGGSIDTAEALQRGDADVAFVSADAAYLSFVGGLDSGTKPMSRLRGLAVLQLAAISLLVPQDSTVMSVPDLRGRHIGVGIPGSSMWLAGRIILDAFGVSESNAHLDQVSGLEKFKGLAASRLDAVFYMASPLRDLAKGLRTLPLTGRPVDQLRRNYPFFQLTIVHDPGQHGQALPTIGVNRLLVCRSGLDDGLVYQVTKTLMEALPEMSAVNLSLSAMDVEQAAAVPIPLHEGAARYYRELELRR